MALNIATITPASLKAKEVATEEYVDSAVASIPVDQFLTYDKAIISGLARVDDVVPIINNSSTYINGNKIATGTISTNALAANAIYGKVMKGGTIEGANIVGSVIRGSWIDLSTSKYMTDWKYYTAATTPALYISNFAHEANGDLTVDLEGFTRLEGINGTQYSTSFSSAQYNSWMTRTPTTPNPVGTLPFFGGYYYEEHPETKYYPTLTPVALNAVYEGTDGISSYDAYTTSNVRRAITNNIKISMEDSAQLFSFQNGYGDIANVSGVAARPTTTQSNYSVQFRIANTVFTASISITHQSRITISGGTYVYNAVVTHYMSATGFPSQSYTYNPAALELPVFLGGYYTTDVTTINGQQDVTSTFTFGNYTFTITGTVHTASLVSTLHNATISLAPIPTTAPAVPYDGDKHNVYGDIEVTVGPTVNNLYYTSAFKGTTGVMYPNTYAPTYAYSTPYFVIGA